MARTEDTALSALLSALGKGVMQLPVEMEKQKEVQRQNALTQYQMMQQQQQQRVASEENALRMNLMRLQQQELNEKIRRAAMEPYLTEEQRMALKQKYELERQAAEYDLRKRNEIDALKAAVGMGVTTSGNTPRSAGGNGLSGAGLKTFLSFANPLIRANEGIKATNVKTMNTWKEEVAGAEKFGYAAPPMPDTLSHLDLGNLSLPVLQGLGVDSITTANILGALSGQATPQATSNVPPMPQGWQGTEQQWIDYLNRKAQTK